MPQYKVSIKKYKSSIDKTSWIIQSEVVPCYMLTNYYNAKAYYNFLKLKYNLKIKIRQLLITNKSILNSIENTKYNKNFWVFKFSNVINL